MDKEEKELRNRIKKILAELLGIEPDDIHDDDSFKEEFQMDAILLTDFLNKLEELGYDSSHIDFNEIDNISELLENVS
jgi:acyl carrier protein